MIRLSQNILPRNITTSFFIHALKMKHVIDPVVGVVNLIRSRELNHRQFKALLDDLETEHSDVLYHNTVQWLSHGKILMTV